MLDYLIVGFGLGGLHLSHSLEESGKTFLVLNDHSQKASKVSGGLCNPVALNNFSLLPNGLEKMRKATETYTSLERKIGTKIYFPMPIHHKFSSEEEKTKWVLASEKASLSAFLNSGLISNHAHIPSKYYFGEIKQSFIVHILKLLHSSEKYLSKRKKYVFDNFDHAQLKIGKGHFTYKNTRAKKIIFCEGFALQQNSFFNYLPLNGNKGEYLIVHIPALGLEETVKGTFFLIPLGNDLYKFGATYEREFEDQEPTENAGQKLSIALEKLIDCPYSIIDQISGIRPTTPDRNPIVGEHPEIPNMFVCNGFGSRGILNAPIIAKELLAFMEHKVPLSSEINCNRFEKKWYSKNC